MSAFYSDRNGKIVQAPLDLDLVPFHHGEPNARAIAQVFHEAGGIPEHACRHCGGGIIEFYEAGVNIAGVGTLYQTECPECDGTGYEASPTLFTGKGDTA